MVEPVEDKDFLAERLEQDRQKMAVQVSELKENYNLLRRLRASMRKYPWSWVISAVLTGFLLSRLPARRRNLSVAGSSSIEASAGSTASCLRPGPGPRHQQALVLG